MKLILSCEHGGNSIPREFKSLFAGQDAVLETHRGFDPGALDLFYHLSDLADFSTAHEISRLLIEVNRSLHHPQLFSEFLKNTSLQEKEYLIEEYYLPYRRKIEDKIAALISNGDEVLHISIHSFTPVLNGNKRNADIGLLYDPARAEEKKYSAIIKKEIMQLQPGLMVRYNYPYLGKADGFTTNLRQKFPQHYAGIELEVNQKFSEENKMDKQIKFAVYKTIEILKQ